MSFAKRTWSAAIGLLLAASVAQAQATRTWVSGVGDDVNPCSRTAPCKTFAGAISKTAAGGEINALDPGGYGAVTITKSITIDGGGTLASILAAGTNGIIVNDSATATPGTIVVRIRNLTINGAGTGLNGIRFLSGAALHVERTTIANFTQRGIDFEPNTSNTTLAVSDTTIENNVGNGILVKPLSGFAARASLNAVRLYRNQAGLRVDDNSRVTVRDSVASHNLNSGFVAGPTSVAAEINLEHCVATGNGTGSTTGGVSAASAPAVVRISQVTSTGNSVGLVASGGGSVISFGNNQIAGNTIADGAPTLTLPQQ